MNRLRFPQMGHTAFLPWAAAGGPDMPETSEGLAGRGAARAAMLGAQ